MTPAERAAVVVVSAWMEDHPGAGFRARLMRLADLDSHEPEIVAAGSVAEALSTLEAWLADLARPSITADPGAGPRGDVTRR